MEFYKTNLGVVVTQHNINSDYLAQQNYDIVISGRW